MNHPVRGYLFVSPCIFAKPQMGSIKENPKKTKPGKFRVLAKPKAAETQKKKEKKLVRKKTVPFGGMGALKQNKNDELILSCLSLFLSSLFKWIFSEYFSN